MKSDAFFTTLERFKKSIFNFFAVSHFIFLINSKMSTGISRSRLMEERKQWRKDHPHVKQIFQY
jgi:hypothetical protein